MSISGPAGTGQEQRDRAVRVLYRIIFLAIVVVLVLIGQGNIGFGLFVVLLPWLFSSPGESLYGKVPRVVWNSRLVGQVRSRVNLQSIALMAVLAFLVFLTSISLAYEYGAQAVSSIVGIIVTVEGILLGLLTLSAFSAGPDSDFRTDIFAVGTIIAILISLAVIMLAQLASPPVGWLRPAFFVDVLAFVIIAGAYTKTLLDIQVKKTRALEARKMTPK